MACIKPAFNTTESTLDQNKALIENITNKTAEKIHKTSEFKTFLQRITMILTFLLLPFVSCIASAIEPEQKKRVNTVIQAFKQNDRIALSKMISYPLFRQAPLAPINNQKEFLERFDEVFDRYLLSTIINSNINTDWDNIGWRGVILGNGIVAVDPEGNITEINHHSQREQTLVAQLNAPSLAKGRRALHRSVNKYDQALVELVTERFRIRVDKVSNGGLRYTSWPIHKSNSDKPDLVLSNGRIINGSGRNQRFVFDNGTYSYQINLNQTASHAKTSGSLEVFKAGQQWVREVATRVIRR